MDLHPSFFLFVVSAAFTPGPNNIMIMSSGLNHGVRASLAHLMGICFGVPTMFLAVGFGLGVVFERYTFVHQAIQLVGIMYLIYLAWLIANTAPSSLNTDRAKPLTFVQAALFQWVNPKAWIMGTSAIAAYTTVGADLNIQIMMIALVFFVVAFASAGVWMVFGASLKRFLSKARYQRVFNWVMALLLLASVVPIVVELVQKFR